MDSKEDENLGSFYMGRTRNLQHPKRFLPAGLLTGLALFSFAVIVWYAYPLGEEKYTDLDVPVVKADATLLKVPPVDPGGMEVPYQDSTVFDPLEKEPSGQVERLLPAAEEPMDKEQALQPPEGNKLPPEAIIAPKLDLAPKMTEKKMTEITEKAIVPAVAIKKPPVPASGNTYIQLGSFRDTSAVKAEWKKLKKKYPEWLAKLEMKTVRVDLPGKGVYYRLQAGKQSKARADETCAALKNGGGGCIVVK